MTEDEAKTKWCPQTGVAAQPIGFGGRLEWNRSPRDVSLPVGENSSTAVHSMSRCIASACMAWRWDDIRPPTQGLQPDEPHPRPSGYCGLAGRPT